MECPALEDISPCLEDPVDTMGSYGSTGWCSISRIGKATRATGWYIRLFCGVVLEPQHCKPTTITLRQAIGAYKGHYTPCSFDITGQV